MLSPILLTKLNIPRTNQEFILRKRLFSKLNAGLGKKLTLVSAPAGFGKTTLVVEWVSKNTSDYFKSQAIWLSLEKNDDNPARFWQYFIRACKKQLPELDSILSILNTSASFSFEPVIISLINEIACQESKYLFILEDYQFIQNPEIHAMLEYFLEHLSENFHLVILSREDPPLGLAKLRVKGQLNEIRAKDLRFSDEEAASFLNEIFRLGLSASELTAVQNRTEGWAAGLQLAALSLRDEDEKGRFIEDFAGSHRFLTDYLMDEVLSHQSDEVTRFLQRLSLLEKFNLSLCQQLMDCDCREILRIVEQAGLFLIPLDNVRNWYRFHHLFSEFLSVRLLETESQLIPELYQKTTSWFLENGMSKEALNYAIKAEDFQQAASLIEKLAPETLEKENHNLVLNWLAKLPEEVIANRPFLMIFEAWGLVLSGQMRKANQVLLDLEERMGELQIDEYLGLEGYLFAHKAYVRFMHGDYQSAIQHANMALEKLPDEAATIKCRTMTLLGNAYNYSGQLDDAQNTLLETIDLAKHLVNISSVMFAYSSLGEVYTDQGRLSLAKEKFWESLEFAEQIFGKKEIPQAGRTFIKLGAIEREQNKLDKALGYINIGIRLCRQWQIGDVLAIGLVELAETYRLMGDYPTASAACQEASSLAREISPWALGIAGSFAARISISKGDLVAAKIWYENAGLKEDDIQSGFQRISEYLTLQKYLIEIGDYEELERISLLLLKRDKVFGRKGRVFNVMLFLAIGQDAMGKTEEAQQTLSEALIIAALENWTVRFIDAGSQITSLLHKLPKSANRDYMLSVVDQVDHTDEECIRIDEYDEKFSQQELKILKLMAAGCSNRDIGEELFLSVNTVRWYASQLYSKLNVKNRGEAVAKAREIKLVS